MWYILRSVRPQDSYQSEIVEEKIIVDLGGLQCKAHLHIMYVFIYTTFELQMWQG